MRVLKKVAVMTLCWYVAAGIGGATEVAFIQGNGEQLKKNVRQWRENNPSAVVTNVNIENYEDQVPSKKGTQRIFLTRGMYVYYVPGEKGAAVDRAKPTRQCIPVSQGIVFVAGYGDELAHNLAQWREVNPDLSLVASAIELEVQVRREDGLRVVMSKGMWVFYSDRYSIPAEQVSSENFVHSIRNGIVFIEGSGDALQRRLSQWKQANPQLSIRTSAMEDFTDQIWTTEGYKRMVVARGVWIFYENTQLSQEGKRRAEIPYGIAEDYFKKAVSAKSTGTENLLILAQDARQNFQDAAYWYDEVLKDYPSDALAAAAALRKFNIRLGMNEPVGSEMLSDIFDKYIESSYELPVIFDLLELFKKRKDLVDQLLLYQRIVKICKDDPYSKETYEAIKSIDRINKDIELIKNTIRP